MSLLQLKALLDEVPDTRELILLAPDPAPNAEQAVWRDARDQASHAYASWRAEGGGEAYAAYRAAQDREDAAQDILAAAA